jgi:hypothetical protein
MMLASLAGSGWRPPHERKYRLAACAMARGLWDRLRHDRLRRLVEVAERFADGMADAADMEQVLTQAQRVVREPNRADQVALGCGHGDAWRAAYSSALQATRTGLRKAGVAAVLSDIFPYPYSVNDSVRPTPTIQALARAAYDERQLPGGELDSVRLAELADALEEAGAAGDLVAHLRGPGLHVRGCWAVDACLALN